MDYQILLSLFGFSENSQEIQNAFHQLAIPIERPKEMIVWRSYLSKKWDVELRFKSKYNFKSDYGIVHKVDDKLHDECVLEEINFGNYNGETNYPFSLPYHIEFAKPIEIIKKMIGLKPIEFSEAKYGSYLLFYSDEYKLLTGFNSSQQLIWVRVMPLDLAFKKKRELLKSFREQNKHIKPHYSQKVIAFKDKLPTIAWKKRNEEGDVRLTKGVILEIEKLLFDYLILLASLTDQRKAANIYNSVKKIVTSLNKIHDKNGAFIETLEREELCEFINSIVRETGYSIEKEIDLTEEWREW